MLSDGRRLNLEILFSKTTSVKPKPKPIVVVEKKASDPPQTAEKKPKP